jgi:hypothetical protein
MSVSGSMYGTNCCLTSINLSMADPTLSTLASSCALPKMKTENLCAFSTNH